MNGFVGQAELGSKGCGPNEVDNPNRVRTSRRGDATVTAVLRHRGSHEARATRLGLEASAEVAAR